MPSTVMLPLVLLLIAAVGSLPVLPGSLIVYEGAMTDLSLFGVHLPPGGNDHKATLPSFYVQVSYAFRSTVAQQITKRHRRTVISGKPSGNTYHWIMVAIGHIFTIKIVMKKALKTVLLILLYFNGTVMIGYGISLLTDLHYPGWLDMLLLPGAILFTCLGVAGMVVTFLNRIHPWWVLTLALIEGFCIAFAIPDQQVIFPKLPDLVLLLGIEGWLLVIISLILMTMESPS